MKTKKEFEVTNETMKKQAFNSTFFNLISLQKEILIEIKFDGEQGRLLLSLNFLTNSKKLYLMSDNMSYLTLYQLQHIRKL